ncbi:MAG: single-stranded-DNA-specific exonuclease RecJ [Phycisphaerae bacterium]|nr:single-stranded-DNA-specific exonuclease RecJ [Phycisphaerae bacterium]
MAASGGHAERDWIIAPPHERRDELASTARIAPLLAQVLLNRGVTTAEEARRFLNPEFKALLPPDVLPNTVAAAKHLMSAIAAGKRITIYGDYDVDGIAGTAILWHAIKQAGGQVSFYIPSRLDEGYGLNIEAVEQIKADGAGVLVTVDCGITAVDEVARARELGLDVIVTDHHQPKDELPPANFIVHPTACGESPNPDLSGAAVALKLAWAIGREASGNASVAESWREPLLDATAFAALGLIADVVPLTGENRVIATFGLHRLRDTPNAGLRALVEVAGLSKKDSYDDYDIGFTLAPRLNAIGRMGHARLAVEMFTRAGPEQAQQIASTLDAQNRQRQKVERDITKQAEAMVTELGFDRDSCRGIVLASSGWHAGVIGIVASRLVDRFHRPAVMISLEGGLGQGSARSVRHFPLHEVLADCEQHLVSFGGHAMAAGLRVREEDIDAFTNAFLAEAAQRLTGKDLRPRLHLDDEVGLRQLTPDVIDMLQRLAPFGPGNVRVRLATTEVELTGTPRVVGRTSNHLQFSVRQGNEQRKAIAFGRGKDIDALADHPRIRVAFEPMISEWNNQRRVELRVLDWKPA